MNENILISVVGPTAIGKTSTSIELAKTFKTEILSCDSRQFYKEMRIGTAVPSKKELNAVQHHFIQNRSIFEDYSVGAFEKDALIFLDHYFKNNSCLVMVGGSGLYADAVTKGLDDFPKVDPQIRQDLKTRLKAEGLQMLQHKLKELDPISYERMDVNNAQRLIRALEICLGTDKPYSYYLGKNEHKRRFKTIKIGLTADRKVIYDRINQRVDMMIDEGLLTEAKALYEHKDLNALQTVGYRELFAYFDGNLSLERAIEEIKKNTRRFAKRQGTWYRRDPDIKWFDYKTPPHEISNYVKDRVSSGLIR